jgi:hypothetical protein
MTRNLKYKFSGRDWDQLYTECGLEKLPLELNYSVNSTKNWSGRPDDRAVSTSEMSVKFYENTRRNIPEDSYLHTHRRENLKSH